jgi:hypothetical protein
MDIVNKDRYCGRSSPEWCPRDAVKVHTRLLKQLEHFVTPPDGKPSLLETGSFLSGVRKVLDLARARTYVTLMNILLRMMTVRPRERPPHCPLTVSTLQSRAWRGSML